MNVDLINDKSLYNERYRKPLVKVLREREHTVASYGIFDGFSRFFIIIIHLILKKDGVVISSNLKCNSLVLLFCRRPKIIILNGMGRYRAKLSFRLVLMGLFHLRANASIILQNYADYRYFQRYCPRLDLEWVPGSGGKVKSIGSQEILLVVQRDNKIESVCGSVLSLIRNMSPTPLLSIVGCKDLKQLERLFPEIDFLSPGFVHSDDILKYGNSFVQPTGYGEGFPHTLADAVVSGMTIYISDIEFLRYGFSKLGSDRFRVADGWSLLKLGMKATHALSSDTISQKTVVICEKHYQKTKHG